MLQDCPLQPAMGAVGQQQPEHGGGGTPAQQLQQAGRQAGKEGRQAAKGSNAVQLHCDRHVGRHTAVCPMAAPMMVAGLHCLVGRYKAVATLVPYGRRPSLRETSCIVTALASFSFSQTPTLQY